MYMLGIVFRWKPDNENYGPTAVLRGQVLDFQNLSAERSETDTVSLSGASGPEALFSPEGTAGESA